MFRVRLYSVLLIAGLILSQLLPTTLGAAYAELAPQLRFLTMIALAFIMIQVGYSFNIDRTRPSKYLYDYVVAMISAALPWAFCAIYFMLAVLPAAAWDSRKDWEHILLLSRFASPTSAGILFSMLAAAGLSLTWVYKKAQILAIFDDVDTILFIIPLQMVMVGFAWQLSVLALFVLIILWSAWRYYRTLTIPRGWAWTLLYAVALASACEALTRLAHAIDQDVPLRLEVLLPSFALGCVIAQSQVPSAKQVKRPLRQDVAISFISACFMLLAGCSMPLIHWETLNSNGQSELATIVLHVAALTLLMNIGKMFPAICYKRKTGESIALGVAMFPRGEVGAGVLVVSTAYGTTPTAVVIATLSLALNLACTGFFIDVVRWLLGLDHERALPEARQF